MKNILITTMMLGVSSVSLHAKEEAVKPAAEVPEKQKRKAIEICFVLDTTGSMGGLIKGAKEKIWSIANEIAQRQNVGEIRFSLVGYRDKGDDYVTKVSGLTNDLDTIYSDLTKFQAAGGGDTPESVNKALNEAVTSMQWAKKEDSDKIIFLVGDAPPQMEYQDDVKYQQSCAIAKKKGIIINTIQCGNVSSTTNYWQEIAQLGSGKYVALPQDGGVVSINAPQDKKIAELSIKIYESAIAYGDKKAQWSANKKQKLAIETAESNFKVNSMRNACLNSHSKDGSVIAFSGNEDLVVEWEKGKVKIDTLKKENLSEEFKELSNDDLKQEIEKRIVQRKKVQQEINALQKERSDYILKQKEKMKKGDAEKAFDEEVNNLLEKQLSK